MWLVVLHGLSPGWGGWGGYGGWLDTRAGFPITACDRHHPTGRATVGNPTPSTVTTGNMRCAEIRHMQHAAQHPAVISENPKIMTLGRIADPIERAAATQIFIERGRQTLRAAERLRDAAIREARSNGDPRVTIDQLAQRICVKRNIVVDALRRSEGGR